MRRRVLHCPPIDGLSCYTYDVLLAILDSRRYDICRTLFGDIQRKKSLLA